MALEQVSAARRDFYSRKHCKELFQICSQCKGLISLCSQDVISYFGIVELKAAFVKHFPKVKYITSKAIRRLMQLSLIIMEIAPDGHGSKKKLSATELQPEVDAQKTSAPYETVHAFEENKPQRKATILRENECLM